MAEPSTARLRETAASLQSRAGRLPWRGHWRLKACAWAMARLTLAQVWLSDRIDAETLRGPSNG